MDKIPPKRKEPVDTIKQQAKRSKKDETDEDQREINEYSEKVCPPTGTDPSGEAVTARQCDSKADSGEEKSSKESIQNTNDEKEASSSNLPHPSAAGELLISGGTDWDLIGRKEIPKNTEIVQNGVSPKRTSGRPRKSPLLLCNMAEHHDYVDLKREVDSQNKKLSGFYWTKFCIEAGKFKRESVANIRRHRAQYTDVQRQAILDYLGKDGATIRSAAKAFNIPKSTIHDMKKIRSPIADPSPTRRKSQGKSIVYDVKKDEEILRWIGEQHSSGEDVLPESIVNKAKEVYTDNERINRIWVKKFLERYESIIGKPKSDSGRKIILRQFLTEMDYFKSGLHTHILAKNISRKLVGNMFELAISLNYAVGSDPKHDAQTSLTTSDEDLCHVTVVMTAMADGKLLSPMIIFKGKDVVNLTIPPGFVVTVQEKPTMNEYLMFAYIEHVWQPYVKKVTDELEVPCNHSILMLDNSEAHTTSQVSSAFEKLSTISVTFPEGAASNQQPVNLLIGKFFKSIMLAIWSTYVRNKIEVRKHPVLDDEVQVHVPLPTEQVLLGWISEAFEALRNRQSMIRKSFDFCGAYVNNTTVSDVDILKEKTDILMDLKSLYGDIRLDEED